MNEGAVFLAIVVIAVFSYRFFAGPTDGISGGGGAGSTSQAPRRAPPRGRQVTPSMVEVIQTMFPHLPPSSIAYDLSRTGSVEITTNNILARNSLPPAPADSPYHQLFPSPQPPSQSSSSSAVPTTSKPDLITRYQLDARLSEEIPAEPELPPSDKGKGKASTSWSQSQAEREKNFKNKRDDMILRARRQMQAQAAAKSEQSS